MACPNIFVWFLIFFAFAGVLFLIPDIKVPNEIPRQVENSTQVVSSNQNDLIATDSISYAVEWWTDYFSYCASTEFDDRSNHAQMSKATQVFTEQLRIELIRYLVNWKLNNVTLSVTQGFPNPLLKGLIFRTAYLSDKLNMYPLLPTALDIEMIVNHTSVTIDGFTYQMGKPFDYQPTKIARDIERYASSFIQQIYAHKTVLLNETDIYQILSPYGEIIKYEGYPSSVNVLLNFSKIPVKSTNEMHPFQQWNLQTGEIFTCTAPIYFSLLPKGDSLLLKINYKPRIYTRDFYYDIHIIKSAIFELVKEGIQSIHESGLSIPSINHHLLYDNTVTNSILDH